MAPSLLPTIIQGGMGVGVSGWRLARAVSLKGQLGVVSGTALDVVLVRRLQLGDPGGHMRRALAEFPLPEMTERIVEGYFIPGGKSPDRPYAAVPMLTTTSSRHLLELIVVANFAEVFLAKEGHQGLVGVNYLENIQLPTLPALFGAMIAGVDYVLMGAGIPAAIPAAMDKLCEANTVELPLKVADSRRGEMFYSRFDPHAFSTGRIPRLERPKFLPIVTSATLAAMLTRKTSGRVDGFVVEGPTAGEHNAPPRGKTELSLRGEPIYGEQDEVDLEAMRSLGLPFWLAGSYGSPQQVVHALKAGAAGVQVGTAFAFCQESGLADEIKHTVIQQSRMGKLEVFTDPVASPAGFPIKVLDFPGSLSDTQVYEARQRCCDLGFFRQSYRKSNGSLGWRCPAEPLDDYVSKGGAQQDTMGRKCVCNAQLANIGLPQRLSHGEVEQPLITCGNEVNQIRQFLPNANAGSYSASDVVRRLMTFVQSDHEVCA